MNRLILFIASIWIFFSGCQDKNIDPDPNIPVLDPKIPTSYLKMDVVQQTIRGFGGTTAWIGALSSTEMTTLYGNNAENQLGLSILRVRISPEGSSQWATELSNAQKANALGATIIAAPWSPPVSMKTNNNIIGGSLKTTSYQAYAAYLKSFADYMRNGGVEIYGISVQNEPDIKVTYESCDWTSEEFLNFVKNYASEVGTTRLMVAESYNFNQAFTDPMLNDAVAASKISIIAGHIYGGGLSWYQNALNKGKEVWMTEHLELTTDWQGALKTGKEIHDCMTIGNYSAYVWWYLKRFYGPIDDNSQPTKRGYVMAQFSKYVRPGYQRISSTSNPKTDIYVSGYKGSGKLVIVALNTSGSLETIQVALSGGTLPKSFTPYLTSETYNHAIQPRVNVTKDFITTNLPAFSITTFVSD